MEIPAGMQILLFLWRINVYNTLQIYTNVNYYFIVACWLATVVKVLFRDL